LALAASEEGEEEELLSLEEWFKELRWRRRQLSLTLSPVFCNYYSPLFFSLFVFMSSLCFCCDSSKPFVDVFDSDVE
jgi:hypothetical protein